jgi:hypothetical protein
MGRAVRGTSGHGASCHEASNYVGNCPFSAPFLCILAGMGAYLPPLTPSAAN